MVPVITCAEVGVVVGVGVVVWFVPFGYHGISDGVGDVWFVLFVYHGVGDGV